MTPSNYLDNAATSFPKPEAVYAAVDRYSREVGAPGGRGAYEAANKGQRILMRCRTLASDLFEVGSPKHVVITQNCTDSLNTVLHGLLQPGDHVVTTQLEHNSVLRPLRFLQERGVESTIVPVSATHRVDVDQVRSAFRSNTRLVASLHASNVSGVIQPVEAIGQLAREHGAMFLLDAAQTAGQYPVSMRQTQADFIVAAGHKSLLGPLGTGLLCIRPGVEEYVASVRQGGTGSASEIAEQPDELPDKYESGNLNMPGIFGLHAGLKHVTDVGVSRLAEHKNALLLQLHAGLSGMEGVTLYGGPGEGRVCIQSLNINGFDPQDVATILDQSFGVQCRAGLHCAPGAHEAMSTLHAGGTVRLSPGAFTTSDDIEQAIDAIGQIAGSAA